MAGKIDKKYHDLRLFLDDEAQGEPEFVNQTQGQVNDVYNLIYDFFSRYFDKGDFLSKKRYGSKNHYMIPYYGEEVLLHWANHDQYYIKTDEFFKNYSFKVGDSRVSFKIKEAETENNNNKGEKKYFISANGNSIEAQKGNVLTIWFQYRALSEEEKKKYITRNIQDELIQEVIKKIDAKNNGWKVTLLKSNGERSSLLEKHLKRYVNKNTCDFFIHKNLRGFLNHELEFFIKNEVLDLDEMELMNEQYLRLSMAKAKAIRGICQKIIEFLAQIEEFQKRLFEKKKFVIRTDYCMTLNKVPEEFYAEIGRNDQQVEEWKSLFKLDINSSNGKTNGKRLDIDFLKSHEFLVLDTKFFSQDFKERLIECFENIDKEIDGLMIKSENWQALNLMQEKYREKVKCIYIDPPYNTGSDQFLYKDNFKHSSWLSMMIDRLDIAKKILRKDSTFFVSIDDRERSRLSFLMQNIFEPENKISEITVKVKDPAGVGQQSIIFDICENLIGYALNLNIFKESLLTSPQELEEITEIIKDYKHLVKTVGTPELVHELNRLQVGKVKIFKCNNSEILNAKELNFKEYVKEASRIYADYNPSGGMILAIRDKIPDKGLAYIEYIPTRGENAGKLTKVYFLNKRILACLDRILVVKNDKVYRRTVMSNLWSVANSSLHSEGGVILTSGKKPEELLFKIVKWFSKEGDIVMDFFVGSGTIPGISQKMGRRWVGIEFDDEIFNIALVRCKNVLAGDKSGISKEVSWQGGGFFKYQYLEQYIDTLNNIIFSDLSNTAQETLDGFDDYFLKYMLDYETRESPARLAVKQFENPFDYKLKVTSRGEEQIETVDLVETFNYLLGLEVQRIRVFENNKCKYRVVFGRKGNDKIVVIWRSIEGIDYEKDKDFVEKTILKDDKYNSIYINGQDSLIPGAEPIEPEFKRLMGA